jgi:hypothetical protein
VERPKGTSWKLVLGVLVALPLLLALVLSQWLGTPQEQLDQDYVFSRLEVPRVPATSLNSLAYGQLFFVRLDLTAEARKTFLRSLAGFAVERGLSVKPISLKLERPWWDPPDQEEGTFWKRGEVTIWNPDSQPESFYAVVLQPKETP